MGKFKSLIIIESPRIGSTRIFIFLFLRQRIDYEGKESRIEKKMWWAEIYLLKTYHYSYFTHSVREKLQIMKHGYLHGIPQEV